MVFFSTYVEFLVWLKEGIESCRSAEACLSRLIWLNDEVVLRTGSNFLRYINAF